MLSRRIAGWLPSFLLMVALFMPLKIMAHRRALTRELQTALAREDFSAALALIYRGADPNTSPGPLMMAIERRDSANVRWLLSYGARANDGALMLAASKCDVEIIKLLVAHGANVNSADHHAHTVLDLTESCCRTDGRQLVKRCKVAIALLKRAGAKYGP